jgi:UDP-N-acetylglucosamine 2-epimerase (non-hydrolysing)
MVLVTGHRRESFGGGFERICEALRRTAEAFPDVANGYRRITARLNRLLVHIPAHHEHPFRKNVNTYSGLT